MGGKVWSAEEERVFWRVIVPQSQKRIGTGPAEIKNWEELARLMQSIMGTEAKRTYTHLGLYLVEHFFQNVEKTRVSPNASVFVREYRQAAVRVGKAEEEERTKKIELDYDNDDVATMVNKRQDTNSQNGTDIGYHASEATRVEDQSGDEFGDEDGTATGRMENWPLGRFPVERAHPWAPTFPSYGPAPTADMGFDDDCVHGMSSQASLSAENSFLKETRWPDARAPAAKMGSYNEVVGVQSRLSTECSPYEDAPSRAPKYRNNHRSHPYEGAKLKRRGRNLMEGHSRAHYDVPQGGITCYAALGSHNPAHHYHAQHEFGHQAPLMERYDYGYHDKHLQPYSEYHSHPQCTQYHPVGFYDRAPSLLHDSQGYASRHPMPYEFCDSQDWPSPDRKSTFMAANYESPDSCGSSRVGYNGHSSGSGAGNYVRSESRPSSGHDYESFISEHLQRPLSSASGSQPLALQNHRQDSHTGSHMNSPHLSAKELDRLRVITLDKEFEPFETSARHQT
ncbi:uncharacterized protein ColSpa_01067 [Colletotrichum spaethianum]|uniref:Uncharacterized protein n=1 Tax=Colletotrichum spaethianum TaxID=700344 RepID=A0AA37L2P9_9PEZI|nr:uncharacterized protein ColSpa_01067 [Colletotrichum spaethianum]GKT40886.1 hypothetical protein ColSpa_01067 [Colletotrichum spaethianum]